MKTLQARIHRGAVYAAWMSTAMASTLTALVAVGNSSWFILRMSSADGADTPWVLDSVAPVVILVIGFVIIVSAVLGGFRKEL